MRQGLTCAARGRLVAEEASSGRWQSVRRVKGAYRAALIAACQVMLIGLAMSTGPASATESAAPSAAPLDALAHQVDASDPGKLVRTAADTLLQALNANRAGYRNDPQKLHALVSDVFLPHFDTQYASRLVLGLHWRSATPAQRTAFTNAFYKSLLDQYGNALLDFTAGRMKVLPYRGEPGNQQATVRTEIKRDDGSTVPVEYSLRLTPQGWKVWDVVIDGISYIKSFRDDFDEEISEKGLDHLITRLNSQ